MSIDIINSIVPNIRKSSRKQRHVWRKPKQRLIPIKTLRKMQNKKLSTYFLRLKLSMRRIMKQAYDHIRLVERIEIGGDYEIEIKFRISVEQYMWIAA